MFDWVKTPSLPPHRRWNERRRDWRVERTARAKRLRPNGSRWSVSSLPRDASDSTHRRVVCQGLHPTQNLGFCHLYIGQESVAVGAAAATQDDWITAYREHGHAMAKGGDPKAIMAEMFGKATGCSKGQGGSMHLFDKEKRFMGGYGIVGAHVPMANGVGWAIRHRNEGRVCVCFFGDGAAHQGAFFEALCLAQLYRLPVVFICENNFYAMGTALDRQSFFTDMSLRANGVGMARMQFEGFDVEVVRENVGRAAAFAREGNGPVLLEVVTYRHRGHSMSDPAKYRPKGELKKRRNPTCHHQVAFNRTSV